MSLFIGFTALMLVLVSAILFSGLRAIPSLPRAYRLRLWAIMTLCIITISGLTYAQLAPQHISFLL